MITDKTHTEEWLTGLQKKFRRKDPGILERVVKALTLLEHLVDSGLEDFVFKGGTSLILILENTKRFSIDIDLCITEKPKNIEDIFDKVLAKGVFTSWELSPRKPVPPLDKEHYKFVFKSIRDGAESNILLDLVFQELHYPELEIRPIKALYIDTEDPVINVQVLPVDCMLGDKLTAFAPDTCGIPYGVNKELEIIKQLYDVSRLFRQSNDLSLVRKTFNISSAKELEYRGLNELHPSDVLEDIFLTSLLLAERGNRRDKEKFEALTFGIRGFANYISDGGFVIEDAIVCGSQAAYLAQLIRKSDETEIKRFDSGLNLKDVLIEGGFNYLNRLKKTSPEAFFYFKEAVGIYESLN